MLGLGYQRVIGGADLPLHLSHAAPGWPSYPRLSFLTPSKHPSIEAVKPSVPTLSLSVSLGGWLRVCGCERESFSLRVLVCGDPRLGSTAEAGALMNTACHTALPLPVDFSGQPHPKKVLHTIFGCTCRSVKNIPALPPSLVCQVRCFSILNNKMLRSF